MEMASLIILKSIIEDFFNYADHFEYEVKKKGIKKPEKINIKKSYSSFFNSIYCFPFVANLS